jgi:uncharacterized cupredoxin-like copper-binding protein
MYTLGNSLCLIAVIITISSVMIFGNMIHYTHAQDKSTLQLSTNKKTYKPGETVTITIKINGKSTLEFSDSTLGLIIQNSKTKQKAGILGSQMMSELKPGESKTVQWDQKDTEGNKYKQELIRLKPLLQLTKIQIIHPQLL